MFRAQLFFVSPWSHDACSYFSPPQRHAIIEDNGRSIARTCMLLLRFCVLENIATLLLITSSIHFILSIPTLNIPAAIEFITSWTEPPSPLSQL